MAETIQERLRVVEGKGDGYGNGPRLRNPDGPEAADALDAAEAIDAEAATPVHAGGEGAHG